jgi:hypothetical protein
MRTRIRDGARLAHALRAMRTHNWQLRRMTDHASIGWRVCLLEFGITLKFLAVISLMMTASASTVAIASDVDWKYFGSITVSGDETSCFFDLRGSVEAPDRHIKVWVKCLRMKAMESIDIEKDFGGKIRTETIKKMVDGYIPPYSLPKDTDSDQAAEVAKSIGVAMNEKIADVSDIKPAIRIFYELDCSKTLFRELNIAVFNVDGRIRSSKDSATEWKYVPPETTVASLQKILCDKSVAR